VLDPESGDLERAGTRIRLQEQPVQVLGELIAHAGSVVTREQLIALLWPKGVVDFDTGLNTIVRKLRSALGDTSETPRYIETLPRRGYRFVGALDPDPETSSGASATVPVSGAAPSSHHASTAQPETVLAVSTPMPSGREPTAEHEATSSMGMTNVPVRRPRVPVLALIAALAVAALLTGVYTLWRAGSGASITSARVEAPSQSGVANVAPASAVAFSPPPHSIAVLPFVNMSGDKEQEYFSDGLTEELLNSLAEIEGLQVVGRASSFYFKGKDVDLSTVSHKLNVGTVLEGSVRHSAHTVRITAQLINSVTGFQIWSKTYDRDLGDVLKLQTEIASAVASALKVTLLPDVATEMKVGGTRNPAAYDAYLRSLSAYWQVTSASDNEAVRAGYQEAARLDPNFALAYAGWSMALYAYAELFAHGAAVGDFYRQGRTQALKAVALAPELAEGHLALSGVQLRSLDFAGASEEMQRAMTLAPGNARVLRDYGHFAVIMGRIDAGIAAMRRATLLDPLNAWSHSDFSHALWVARRYDEALAVYQDSLALRPKDPNWTARSWAIYYALGDFEKMRTVCEGVEQDDLQNYQDCLALAYHKLGRQTDAASALARYKALEGDAGAYGYSRIYAQWGNTREALTWLETAVRLRDPQLASLKTDPFLDPLRKEPRFQVIEKALRFPE
jgi:TolB-like protein/DNA-binding winged helix-turn-helix (wHTH) protein/Tfp pilus assembly protein PilF